MSFKKGYMDNMIIYSQAIYTVIYFYISTDRHTYIQNKGYNVVQYTCMGDSTKLFWTWK